MHLLNSSQRRNRATHFRCIFTDISLVDRSADEFADGEEITVNELPKDAAVAICTRATNQESK